MVSPSTAQRSFVCNKFVICLTVLINQKSVWTIGIGEYEGVPHHVWYQLSKHWHQELWEKIYIYMRKTEQWCRNSNNHNHLIVIGLNVQSFIQYRGGILVKSTTNIWLWIFWILNFNGLLWSSSGLLTAQLQGDLSASNDFSPRFHPRSSPTVIKSSIVF